MITAPPVLRALSPLAYLEDKRQARALVDAHRWAEAAVLLQQMVTAYPYDGGTWRDLGDALEATNAHKGAAAAYAKAYQFGLPSYGAENAAKAAAASAADGDERATARWLRVAIDDLHYRDPDGLLADPAFKGMRGKAWFNSLLPKRSPALQSRDARWRADVDTFLDRLARLRPDLTAAQWSKLRTAAARLKAQVPELDDAGMAIELQRLQAMTGRGHSGSPALWDATALHGTGLRSLPIDFYLFPDGLYITGGEGQYASLAGSRVLSFGSVPADQALRRSAALIDRDPGSEMSVVWLGPWFLTKAAVLERLGLGAKDQVTLTLTDRSGKTRSVTVAAGPFRARPKLYSPAGAPTVPLYLQHVHEPFWVQELGPGTTYVQFNQVADSRSETLAQFGVRLRDHLRQARTSRLIVDIRHNNGGDTYLYTELLRTLVAFDAEAGHRLFLITGRNTFSAAQNFAVDVDRLTNAIIAGEPASAPRAGGDEVTFTLPFSKIPAGAAPVQWSLQSPSDDRVWIAPDLPVTLTASDYFGGRDPILDAVLAVPAQPAKAK